MGNKKIPLHRLPDEIMAYVLNTLQKISFGEVVLVAQDGVLVQIEWSEKVRADDIISSKGVGAAENSWDSVKLDCVAEHIRREFSPLNFGKLVIVIKRGAVVQIERTEKQRFTGLYGEGI